MLPVVQIVELILAQALLLWRVNRRRSSAARADVSIDRLVAQMDLCLVAALHRESWNFVKSMNAGFLALVECNGRDGGLQYKLDVLALVHRHGLEFSNDLNPDVLAIVDGERDSLVNFVLSLNTNCFSNNVLDGPLVTILLFLWCSYLLCTRCCLCRSWLSCLCWSSRSLFLFLCWCSASSRGELSIEKGLGLISTLSASPQADVFCKWLQVCNLSSNVSDECLKYCLFGVFAVQTDLVSKEHSLIVNFLHVVDKLVVSVRASPKVKLQTISESLHDVEIGLQVLLTSSVIRYNHFVDPSISCVERDILRTRVGIHRFD